MDIKIEHFALEPVDRMLPLILSFL
jgi:hypothetical protein